MDCIHCGLCLSQCPTYAEEGLEADSPRGRIYIMRALAEGRAEPSPSLVEHLDRCLGCRACETACPSGVQYGHLIEGTRAYLRENYRRPWRQRLVGKLVETIFPYPARLEAALLPVRVLRRTGVLPLLHRTGVMKALGPLGDAESLLPLLPPMQRRLHFPERWRARGAQQARVGMITGCVMQVMQTPVNEATARVLTKAGCDVGAPRQQGCCGALMAHSGGMDEAKALARRNIEVFEEWEASHGALDAIIINAAGCGAALKEYPGWFKDDVAWAARAAAFSAKVQDVSEFLAQPRYKSRLVALMDPNPQSAIRNRQSSGPLASAVLPNTVGGSTLQALGRTVLDRDDNQAQAEASDSSLSAAQLKDAIHAATTPASPSLPVKRRRQRLSGRRITYHDACHLAHGQGVRAQPRELLEAIPNLEIVPLAESEMCCGSAGSYNITQPAMAMQLLQRKMGHVTATGADIVVTGNPGCTMQILLGARQCGTPIEVRHIVELLDEATQ